MRATDAQIDAPSAGRLVIRIKLIPQEAPQARWRLSRSALVIVGVVSVLLLSWIGISTFMTDTTDRPAAAQTAHTVTEPPVPAVITPVQPEVQQQPDAPTSTIHEVLPDVPQSALNTIRGTVRVSIRVTVDPQGKVVGVTTDDRGPSRYFERLALKASKQWTFTPAKSEQQRTMRVRFNFTRAGVTAQASPLQ
jgi:TonB family protein